jgi:hypothetical protein
MLSSPQRSFSLQADICQLVESNRMLILKALKSASVTRPSNFEMVLIASLEASNKDAALFE